MNKKYFCILFMILSIIAENKTDNATSDSYVLPGDVKKTKRIWMRVVGDF